MRNVIKIYPDHFLLVSLLLYLISPFLTSSAKRCVCMQFVCVCVCWGEREMCEVVSETDRWCFKGGLLLADPEVTKTSRGQGEGRWRWPAARRPKGQCTCFKANFKIISQFDIMYLAVHLLKEVISNESAEGGAIPFRAGIVRWHCN